MTSVCGVHCDKCKDFKKTCEGCEQIKGKVYWASYVGADTCPMYDCCVNKKTLAHCGKCSELPCKLYYNTQDPAISNEEHEKGIRERVEILKSLK